MINSQIEEYVLRTKYAAVYIAYFNSAINPVLYGGFNENFRKGFKDAFKCILLRRRNTVTPCEYLASLLLNKDKIKAKRS